MNCNVVKDLLPLYIDECCSDESLAEVKKHLETCTECSKTFKRMNSLVTNKETNCEIKKCTRINDWKASVMQSLLFLFSFLTITVGVYFEAATGYDVWGNSLAAFNIVVPATGFMLSLTNWYFIRLYKSKKIFSWCCCAFSVLLTIAAFAWSSFHYEFNPLELFGGTVTDFFEVTLFWFGAGIFLTVFFAVLSKILSSLYAKMLGKE